MTSRLWIWSSCSTATSKTLSWSADSSRGQHNDWNFLYFIFFFLTQGATSWSNLIVTHQVVGWVPNSWNPHSVYTHTQLLVFLTRLFTGQLDSGSKIYYTVRSMCLQRSWGRTKTACRATVINILLWSGSALQLSVCMSVCLSVCFCQGQSALLDSFLSVSAEWSVFSTTCLE